MRDNSFATYATIGTICGGTAGVAQAIVLGSSPILGLLLAAASGAAAGLAYAYVKLRRAARR